MKMQIDLRRIHAIFVRSLCPLIAVSIALGTPSQPTNAQSSKPNSETPPSEQSESPKSETTTPTPVERARLPTGAEAELNAQKVLAESLHEEGEILWLEANGEEFLGLWQTDTSGTPEGAILLLHHAGQHIDWPSTLRNLRTTINRHGWGTLAISLPNPLPTAIPQREFNAKPSENTTAADSEAELETNPENGDESSKAPENSNEEPNMQASQELPNDTPSNSTEKPLNNQTEEPPQEQRDIEAIAQARIKKGIDFLYSRGQFNLVILGDGLGAARAMKYVTSDGEKNWQAQKSKLPKGTITKNAFRAYILVNAWNTLDENEASAKVNINSSAEQPLASEQSSPSEQSKQTEEEAFSIQAAFNNPDMPILDIVYYPRVQFFGSFAERKKWADTNQLKYYQQKKLLMPNTLDSEPHPHAKQQKENRLSRLIRGFLERHAKGVKVNR